MKLYIDAQRDLIPTAAPGSDGCVFLHLRTSDWALHHSVVMSPAEAREIAADLMRAATGAEALLRLRAAGEATATPAGEPVNQSTGD